MINDFTVSFICSGRGKCYIAGSLDAPGVPAVSDIYSRIGRLELRCRALGDIYLWQAAVVPDVEPRGMVNVFRSTFPLGIDLFYTELFLLFPLQHFLLIFSFKPLKL